jgi:hypothetical protein
VSTDVQKSSNLTLAVAGEDDGVLSHVSTEKVIAIRNLAFVAKKEPASSEDPFELEFINLWIDEDPPVDETPLRIN